MKTETQGLTRREFLVLSSASALALGGGCATNPVSGRRMFVMVSEADEISQDKQAAPHQFSADYGPMQDAALTAYVTSVGERVAAQSHRPAMPYSFRPVNAAYVNAYTFPGGSVAVTRGMLLQMQSEAELAAVLGHEIGHVNARHTARAMTWGMMGSLVVAGASAYLGTKNENYGMLAAGLGQLGAGLLLARYSRDNEREADALGLDYMVRAEYNPDGMVALMDLLKRLSDAQPGYASTLFATHPMSSERHRTMVEAVQAKYAAARRYPLGREAYLDRTAALRARRTTIEELQKGEEALAAGKLSAAQPHVAAALKSAPDDYAALVMMAKTQLAAKQPGEARRYAEAAQAVYPQEAQACHVTGMAALAQRDFGAALQAFQRYEERLPGNPNTVFFKGYSFEGLDRRQEAAPCYDRYLRSGAEGDYAKHAYAKLVEWGYVGK